MNNPQSAIRNPQLPLPSPRPDRLFWRYALAAFLVSLVLYAPALNAFFIVDDLSTLAHVAPQTGHSWWSVLTPESNGFLRVTREASARVLLALCGMRPLPFHLLGLAVHSLVAALAGLLALRLPGGRPAAGWLAALLMAAHIGAWSSATMLGNFCDAYLALGLLGGLLAWLAWLEHGRRRDLALALAGFIFAAISKETAMVAPALVTLLTLAANDCGLQIADCGLNSENAGNSSVPRSRRIWMMMGALWLAAGAFAAWVVWSQAHHATSYLGIGALSHSPKNFARQFADFAASTLVPFLHLLAWPAALPALANGALWAIRALVLAGLGVVAVRFFIRPRGRWTAFLILAAAVPLLPPSLLTAKPNARFVYAALPFVCAALARALAEWRGARRAALAAVGTLWLTFAAGFYASPTLRDYRRDCRQVGAFVEQTRQAAPGWERGATIAIFNHPHPAPPEWRWVYGQLIYNLFIPEARATLALDAITPQTRRAYRFENGKLVELPLAPR